MNCGKRTHPGLTGRALIAVVLLLSALPLFAQKTLPVIKATSPTVDIRDGNHLKKGYWSVMPERKPDYYFVELPQKPHKVTFITDLDSVSVDVTYGKEYAFILVVLVMAYKKVGKKSAHTRKIA
jgi:hypothetical protein